jgi:lipopolysaccharide heptosyltransferase II
MLPGLAAMGSATSGRSAAPARNPQSIIVLAREHIGDLICTTPALRALRQLYPQAHICVEAGERALIVLKNIPYIDELLPRPKHQGRSGRLKLIKFLRSRRFDLGVMFDDSTHMPLTLWLGGVKFRAGIVRKGRYASLLNVRVPYRKDRHEMIDNFAAVVEALGGEKGSTAPDLPLSQEDLAEADRRMAEAGLTSEDIVIGLIPSCSVPIRNWPTARFAELCDLLASYPAIKPVLLPGPSDAALCAEIIEKATAKPATIAGTSVMVQSAIQKRCAAILSGDTGPVHMAAAVGTPVVTLHGISEVVRFGAYYVPGNIQIVAAEPCTGCAWEKCVNGGRCMRSITAQQAAEALLSLETVKAQL